jgi:hypothetical protein
MAKMMKMTIIPLGLLGLWVVGTIFRGASLIHKLGQNASVSEQASKHAHVYTHWATLLADEGDSDCKARRETPNSAVRDPSDKSFREHYSGVQGA